MHVPASLTPHAGARFSAPVQGQGLPVWVIVVTLLVAFVRFGYHYASGDQDELVPSLLQLLDGTLFTRDWIVQTVTSGVNVRTFFVWLMALPSFVLPAWLAVLLLWLAVSVSVCYATFALAREFDAERVGAALSVVLVVAVTVRWTVGGNAIAYDALLPEGVGWALALPGIVAFLRRREALAGALLGVAAWFHLLAGLHPALVLGGAALLVGWEDPRATVARLLTFGGTFLVAGLPILAPVAWEHVITGPVDVAGASPFYIHAYFRNPHHHLYVPPDWGRWLRFLAVLAAGLASGLWLAHRGMLRHGRLLCATGGVILILLAVGAAGVHWIESSILMKLQFQKLTVLANVVATILVASAIGRQLPALVRRRAQAALDRSAAGLAAATVVVAVVLVLSAAGVGRPGGMLHPVRHAATPLGEAETWARQSTPVEALFAIPPSVDTFRSNARRSVVANFDAFVFTDAAMQHWFNRLLAIAPIVPPPTGQGVRGALDAAYHAHGDASWRELIDRFGIDYVLVRQTTELPFPLAFENAGWRIYAVPRERRER